MTVLGSAPAVTVSGPWRAGSVKMISPEAEVVPQFPVKGDPGALPAMTKAPSKGAPLPAWSTCTWSVPLIGPPPTLPSMSRAKAEVKSPNSAISATTGISRKTRFMIDTPDSPGDGKDTPAMIKKAVTLDQR